MFFMCYFFQPKSGPAFLVRSRKFASTVSWVIKFGVEITLEVLDLHDSLIYGCFCFQLEVHVRDECPATEVQSGHKNLGFEAVVWTFYTLKNILKTSFYEYTYRGLGCDAVVIMVVIRSFSVHVLVYNRICVWMVRVNDWCEEVHMPRVGDNKT